MKASKGSVMRPLLLEMGQRVNLQSTLTFYVFILPREIVEGFLPCQTNSWSKHYIDNVV